MDRHSRLRRGVVPLVVACIMGTAGCGTDAEPPAGASTISSPGPTAPAAPEPTPVPAPTSAPTPSAPPEPEPETLTDAEAARLEELRDSEAFVELAEASRAATAPFASLNYELFEIREAGETLHTWTNKEELWDSIAPDIRDDCLSQGSPATEPLWDGKIVIPAGVQPIWTNDTTGGRGQFVQFFCVYEDPDGYTVERWYGVLVDTDADGSGRLLATAPPFDVREGDHRSYDERARVTDEIMWSWIDSRSPRP